MKFKDFQAPVLVFKYFQGLEFRRKKFQVLSRMRGNTEFN